MKKSSHNCQNKIWAEFKFFSHNSIKLNVFPSSGVLFKRSMAKKLSFTSNTHTLAKLEQPTTKNGGRKGEKSDWKRKSFSVGSAWTAPAAAAAASENSIGRFDGFCFFFSHSREILWNSLNLWEHVCVCVFELFQWKSCVIQCVPFLFVQDLFNKHPNKWEKDKHKKKHEKREKNPLNFIIWNILHRANKNL